MKTMFKRKIEKYKKSQKEAVASDIMDEAGDAYKNENNFNLKNNDRSSKSIKDIFLNFQTIRTKFILAFLLPVVLIIILGVLSYSLSSKGLIESYKSSTMSNMSNIAKYLNFGFDTVATKASILNSNKTIQYYYSGRYKKDEEMTRLIEIQEFFNSNILSEDYIANIYMFANYGSGIYGNGSLKPDLYETFITKEGAVLNENKKETAWLGYHSYLDSQTISSEDSYAVSFITYMYSITNKKIGFIVIDVTPQYIEDTLEGSGLPDGSIIALITDDGREIINGNVPDSFKFIKQSYYTKAVKNVEENGQEYVKFNNKEYLFVYSKVKSSNSLLCAVIPKEVILMQASKVKNITLIIVIIASIIAIAFGTFMASDYSNIIHKTIQVLQKTASGDLSHAMSIKRRDEFNILGVGINEMISSMKGLIQKMAGISKTVFESASVVSKSSNILVSATQNISGAVGNIEQGITQQAEDAENCLFQMSDLAEKINEVYINTNNIEQIAGETKEIVKNGIVIVDDLGNKAKNTSDITRNVINDIESLEKESAAITGIIDTINNIAEQTNLLSLNASIEAARAGTAGLGFTVVAEEIRKLADQSLKASNEIRKIIDKIENRTRKTADTARNAESIIISQEEALHNTVNLFTNINKHFENLTDNLNQVVSGVEGIENAKNGTLGAIESISAASEETAAAASQLGETAEEQLKEVKKLYDVVKQLSDDSKVLEETVNVFKVY